MSMDDTAAVKTQLGKTKLSDTVSRVEFAEF